MNPRNNVPADLLFLFTLQHSKLTQSHNLHERPSVHVWPAITQTGPFTRTFVFPSWSQLSFCCFKNCIFSLNFGIPIWENIPSLFLRSGFFRSRYCFSLASLLNLFWGQPNGLGWVTKGSPPILREVRRGSKSKWTKNRECCETRQSKEAGKEKRCQRVVEGMSKYACLNEWISDKLLVNCVHASLTSLRRWLTPIQKMHDNGAVTHGSKRRHEDVESAVDGQGFRGWASFWVQSCVIAWVNRSKKN